MAITHPDLDAYETTYLALDRPILGVQAIPASPTAVWWHNSNNTVAHTDTTYPERRAYDGYGGIWTQPSSVADKDWYFSINASSSPMTFDFVAILNHNLGTIHAGGALTVVLQADDAATFDSGAGGTPQYIIPITVTTTASNSRIMQLSLAHTGNAQRYTDVPYARLRISRAATNFSELPRIGELILGRRYQQKHRPRLPHDSTSLHAAAERSETMGGVISTSAFSAGRRHLSATFREWDSTYTANLIAWFKATNYGTRPFVWIENPQTAPNSWYYMVLDDPDFDFPTENFADRNITIEATEQGPENCYLDRGIY